jgi:hypothetical protein
MASQGDSAVAIGVDAGQCGQATKAVAIGARAGENTQGASAIAIGEEAGQTNQAANSIILNATGGALNTTTASSFHVKPVRGGNMTASALSYTADGEIVEQTNIHFDGNGRLGVATTTPSASFHNNGNKAILNNQLGLQTVNVYKSAGGNSGAQTRRYYRIYVPNSYTNFQIIFRGFGRNYTGAGDIQDWRRQYTVQRNHGAGLGIAHDSGEDINANGFTFAVSQTGSASQTIEVHFDVTFPAKPQNSTYLTFSAEVIGDSGSFAETQGI